jgi:ABC-type lipoprotein release transport system permease subunit
MDAIRTLLSCCAALFRKRAPLAYALASVLFVVVALLACYIPARRAMRINPIVALRHERVPMQA